MALAAVNCLIGTLEDLLRFTSLAVKINNLQIDILHQQQLLKLDDSHLDSLQLVDHPIGYHVQQAAQNMLNISGFNSLRYIHHHNRSYKYSNTALEILVSCHVSKLVLAKISRGKSLYFLAARAKEIYYLCQDLGFLLSFLKDLASICQDPEKAQHLEGNLVKLACRMEDVIEGYLFDHSINSKTFNFVNGIVNGQPSSLTGEVPFIKEILNMFDKKNGILQHLLQTLKEIDLIKREVKRIYDTAPIVNENLQLGQNNAISLQHVPTKKIEIFDHDFLSVLDRIVRRRSTLELVTIVGMGGIGKTTLAQIIFDYALTCHHFHIRAWVAVSQVYQVRDILIGILRCIHQITDEIYGKSNGQLAEELYKSLKGKTFLVVLDNIWSTKTWDDVRRCFPNDRNGSSIVLTTRLMKVADYVNPKQSPLYVTENLQFGQNNAIALQHEPTKKNEIFDIDNVGFLSVLDRVVRVPSALEMVPIVGMGGIGKTTLARRVFDYALTCHHFYIRAWVVVSQVYQVRDILIGLLRCINQITDEIHGKSNGQLAEELYRSLKGKRFLIVLDNIWSTKAWDDVKRCFPDDKNGSRIVLTTRLLKVADYVNPKQPPHYVNLLDVDQSWMLLQQKVFGEEPCPLEFEDVGRRIARKCKGLPLAIVVIAGILCKIMRTLDCWEHIAKSVSSVVSSDPEQCLEVLALSYNHLPSHLKTCFLYMGAFPEGCEIGVPKLINLWIAEGFLDKKFPFHSEDVKSFSLETEFMASTYQLRTRSISSLEIVAEAYLEDLIDRNLVFVGKRSFSGKIKTCRLHDLVQDLCWREAQKAKFMNVMKRDCETLPANMTDQRRLSLHSNIFGNLNSAPSMPLVRSFLYFNVGFGSIPDTILFRLGFKLLRVLDIVFLRFQYFPLEILKLIQLRYLALTATFELPVSISKLRNLHTLIIHGPWIHWEHGESPTLLLEYWNMPWLRHLHTSVACYLSNPFIAKKNLCTPWRPQYLQSLSAITFSSCSEEVFSLMPFLKKLGIFESEEDYRTDISSKWLSNLVHLKYLETLKCSFYVQNGSSRNNLHWLLPSSLKKLTLSWSYIPWGNMTLVAMLPNLEVLKLKNHAFQGQEWEPSEDGFQSLKHLLIENHDLVHLEASRIEFPRLEHLALRCCKSLVEIPFGIAEIPTLQLIEVHYCSESAEYSVKEIQEQIDGLNVDIRSGTYSREM